MSSRRNLLPDPRRGFAFLGLIFVLACQTQTPPDSVTEPGATSQAAAAENATPASDRAADTSLPETERWAALFIKGKKIGFQHTKRTHVKTDDGVQLRVESTAEIRIRRFGGETRMRMEQEATETGAGALVDFESRLTSGTTTQTTTGHVRDGMLSVRQGSRDATALPLPAGGGSFAAVDHSLERKPLKPGETRTIHQIEPALGGVLAVTLEAKDWESTKMLSGSYRLLRIEGKMKMANGVTMPLTLWTDKSGDTLKTTSSLGTLKQVAYRTSKKIALAPADGAAFDLGIATTVPLKRNIAAMHEKSRARYRVRLKVDSDGHEFASGGSQSVKRIDARTLEVTVVAVRPGQDADGAEDDDKPTDAELSASSLIESDAAVIIGMAEKASRDAEGGWAVSKQLEKHVHRAIRKKNFSSAFDSAATVAKTLSGDCTEHAVLLAALARAKKIPARVAVGLVYMAGSNALGMHMWTEVWIDDRWIGLDATLGRGGLGPGHIKIAHTSLDGPSAYSSLLPVAQLLGQMEIDVLDVE